MSDADALLAAVLADPDADLPRLVYADWLDDAGDPLRAEFIRVQIALAAEPGNLGLQAREQTLLHLYREKWLAPLRAAGEPLHSRRTHGQFVRGFVERVWMPPGIFRERAARLFHQAPVRSLRMIPSKRDQLPLLLADPHLGRLRELELTGCQYGDGLADEIARAPAGRLPPVLALQYCGLTLAGARALAGVGSVWRPIELQVGFNPLVSDGGLEVLKALFGTAVRTDR